MLDPLLVPSPLLGAEETAPVEIVPLKAGGRFETLRLVFHLAGLGFHLLWLRVTRRGTPIVRARMVRAFMEEHGGLWVKAGQLFSLRTDVFSREMVDELSQLAYRANGFAPDVA
ncbi:MAG: hypothetical protein JOZ04_14465, partial [Acidimicrobiia bacterium]|nr:hypothetical protein [Acidimicrobiia bacterium]